MGQPGWGQVPALCSSPLSPLRRPLGRVSGCPRPTGPPAPSQPHSFRGGGEPKRGAGHSQGPVWDSQQGRGQFCPGARTWKSLPCPVMGKDSSVTLQVGRTPWPPGGTAGPAGRPRGGAATLGQVVTGKQAFTCCGGSSGGSARSTPDRVGVDRVRPGGHRCVASPVSTGPPWVPVSTRKGHARPQRACAHPPGLCAVSLCTEANAHPAATPRGLGQGHGQGQGPCLCTRPRRPSSPRVSVRGPAGDQPVQGGAPPQAPREQELCPACRSLPCGLRAAFPGAEPGLNLAAEAFIAARRAGALAGPTWPLP